MTIPSLTAPPDLPDRTEQDQTLFDTRMAAYWAYFKDDFEPELNSITTAIDSAVTDVNADAATATTQAGLAATAKTEAETAEDNAAASAATALSAPGTSATSVTELTVGIASKTLTIQTGKSLVVGMSVKIAHTASPTTWMHGDITSYTTGTGELIVDVTAINGSGTQSAWTVSLSAPGAAGLGANVFTGQQTFKETKDTSYTITDGAAFEIDPANGNIQTVTLGADRTPLATNFENGQMIDLGIDDGTDYTVTWTGVAVTWLKVGGTASAPTLATSGYTWVNLEKVGGVIYGKEIGSP